MRTWFPAAVFVEANADAEGTAGLIFVTRGERTRNGHRQMLMVCEDS